MPSNNTNKEGSTPACYGASDNSRNMNDPSPPSPTPVEEVIDAPEPSSEEDIQLALDRLLNCATTLLRNNINRNQQGSLKEILRINPQLCKQIKDSPEDLLGNLEAPSVQIMQGLIRGFQKELTPIPVENADGNLYAGSIIEGLNPSDEINVIINLDPARVNLETRGVINYQTYHIHDTDAGEGSEEERQIKESLTQAFNQVLKCLAERKRVLIHCMEGKNRTGTLITIVKAHLEGNDFDTA